MAGPALVDDFLDKCHGVVRDTLSLHDCSCVIVNALSALLACVGFYRGDDNVELAARWKW